MDILYITPQPILTEIASTVPLAIFIVVSYTVVPVYLPSSNMVRFHFQSPGYSAWLVMLSGDTIDPLICPLCDFDPDRRSIANWSRQLMSGTIFVYFAYANTIQMKTGKYKYTNAIENRRTLLFRYKRFINF